MCWFCDEKALQWTTWLEHYAEHQQRREYCFINNILDVSLFEFLFQQRVIEVGEWKEVKQDQGRLLIRRYYKEKYPWIFSDQNDPPLAVTQSYDARRERRERGQSEESQLHRRRATNITRISEARSHVR